VTVASLILQPLIALLGIVPFIYAFESACAHGKWNSEMRETFWFLDQLTPHRPMSCKLFHTLI